MLLFKTHTKIGQLQVEETTVRVMAAFHKLVWEVPRGAITQIVQQSSALSADLTFLTPTGMYTAPDLTKVYVPKLLVHFAGTPVQTLPKGDLWFLDPAKRTYIAVYKDEKTMQQDMQAIAQYGWVPQNASASGASFSAGKALAGGVLLGPVGLLAGASGKKGTFTVMYARTPEWLAAHPLVQQAGL